MNEVLEKALEAEQTAKAKMAQEEKYTLTEATTILKEMGYMRIEDAVGALAQAYRTWEDFKGDDTCLAIFNDYYDGELYGTEDFMEEINITNFIWACKAIVKDYNYSYLKCPEILIENADLEEHFKEYIDDFWEKLDWNGSLDTDDVEDHYKHHVDLEPYVDKLNLDLH